MLNIVKMLEQNLTKESYMKNTGSKVLGKTYVSPSEAMCYTNEGAPVGSCIRQVWFKKKKAPETNEKSLYSLFIFEAGHMWEDWLVKQYQELNIYLDRSIKLVDNDLNISCEIDILHTNPVTGAVEITECKQYSGANWYAAKDLLGTAIIRPKPKDQNLLQCVKYLLVAAKYDINIVNLIYLDRSCSGFYNNKQFSIYLKGKNIYYDTFHNGELITVQETRFNTDSLLEKDSALIQMIELDCVPAPDYFISYTPETLEIDYARGAVTKTTYNKIKKGEINIEDQGSWNCRYCSYGKNPLTGESTCLNYIE